MLSNSSSCWYTVSSSHFPGMICAKLNKQPPPKKIVWENQSTQRSIYLDLLGLYMLKAKLIPGQGRDLFGFLTLCVVY